ncbi:hypothetical protein PSTG_10974 [Puccinia striiformis f. sp. tritici PST-78]|uniref:No apical meristem-associated C-terminal domain-containing protein n=1 Tax=Puccinia striiformis f. sp. tritici PST-78 TaxID=1165861 RepID=A0A0L0V902_9BASI|nr:hypothetical protein PSTG_10974 [Puccinia striiformis f. sp. tritici PST-78]
MLLCDPDGNPFKRHASSSVRFMTSWRSTLHWKAENCSTSRRPSHLDTTQSHADSQTTESPANGDSAELKDWIWPPGAHSSKRKLVDNDYRSKKMKFMEASYKELMKRLAEAKRSNNIQAELVESEKKKIDLNLMFPNPNIRINLFL